MITAIRRGLAAILIAPLLLCACAPEPAQQQQAETPQIAMPPDFEALNIEAKRYEKMLAQVRGVLALPAPTASTSSQPETESPAIALAESTDGPEVADVLRRLIALDRLQSALDVQFRADTKAACAKADLPASLHDLACADYGGRQGTLFPDEPEKYSPSPMKVLRWRNQKLADAISPWRKAACALPNFKGGGDGPFCPIE